MSAPPAYSETIGTSAESPYGLPEDLAVARDILHKRGNTDKIFGAWRTGQRAIDNIPWMQIRMLGILPCFWPHLLIMSPCLVPAAYSQKEYLRNLIYILTEESIVIACTDFKPPCCTCCTTGRDFTEVSYDKINEVKVNNAGTGCACLQIPVVTVSTSTMVVAQNGRAMPGGHQIYSDKPDEIAAIIRNARKASKRAAGAANVTVVTQPTVEKRVFVAHASARTAFQMILVSDSDMETFKTKVCEKFGLKSVERFELDGVGVSVSDIREVQNNDKLIAF